MSMRTNDLRLLNESRDYPALLSRLYSGVPELPSGDALRDVLEQDLRAVPAAERFDHLRELGELGAALAVRGEDGRDAGIVATKIQLHQDIELLLRQIQGRLLILSVSNLRDVGDFDAELKVLASDTYMRDYRPGPLRDRLQRLDEQLHGAIEQAREQVRGDTDELRGASGDDRDLAIALQRIAQLPPGTESLPTEHRLVQLAKRARDGQLGPEDLRYLHQQGQQSGRLVRPRGDFPQIQNANEALNLIDRNQVMRFPGDVERDQTIKVLKSLVASPLNTHAASSELGKFIGFRQDEKAVHRTAIGSAFRLVIPAPRIPAFREGVHYARGLQLVLPVAEQRVQDLLREMPADAMRIVFIVGRQEGGLRSPYGADDLVYFDLVDLLRLGECSLHQRLHAWQQLLLPRLKLQRIKPYQGGGPVEPEMFRGRSDVIESLRKPRGGTVLFSGRMMGKSSILTKIFNDIEARRAGDPTHPDEVGVFLSNATEDLYGPLYAKLIALLGDRDAQPYREKERADEASLTEKLSVRREKAMKRLARMRALIEALLQRYARLTILIDEADKFAAADAERAREESLAWLLRDLEFQYPARLRVIFAGFQTIHHQVLFKNGAFANWFGMKELGALDPADARSLVIEPFADFGFVFSSEAAIDRILEFTGRHPLLTQEVCSKLMDRVGARRRPDQEDVVVIQAGDVEAVCRDDSLRDRLRQVLGLNLEDHPRLKLMVYLLVFASSRTDRSLSLEQFSLADLAEILIGFYDGRFDEYFDKRGLGALLQGLMAVGLVSRLGDNYSFVNRTLAGMLREDRGFDAEITRLLDKVTDPDCSTNRRFHTLPDEDLERVLRLEHGHALFVGLPQSARSTIAERLYGDESGAYLLAAKGCGSLEQLRVLLREQLRQERKTLSIIDLLVMTKVNVLVLDEADALAEGDALGELIEMLDKRGIHLVAFGGAALARHYVTDLAARHSIDVLSLRRLRPQDIRDWGECSGVRKLGQEHQITFDHAISEQLARVTGGYMGLLHGFREFIRTGRQHRANEFVPEPKDIDAYAHKLVTPDAVARMLEPLLPDECRLLARLYEFARREDMWDIEWEFVESEVLEPLTTEGGRGLWRDRLELLRLLDLVEERTIKGQRRLVLTANKSLFPDKLAPDRA